jgi:sortase (surface protein transpeptidase)
MKYFTYTTLLLFILSGIGFLVSADTEPPRDITTYALFAYDSIQFQGSDAATDRGFISGGNVGVNNPTQNDHDISLNLGNGNHIVTMTGGIAVGDSMHLAEKNTIEKVFANSIKGNKEVRDAFTPIATTFPIITENNLPQIPTFIVSSTEEIRIKENESRVLTPKSYGEVEIHDDGTLMLSSGTYIFQSLRLGKRAHIGTQPNTRVLIAGTMRMNNGSLVEGSDQAEFIIRSDNTGNHDPSVSFGKKTVFHGQVFAPNGTIDLGHGTNLFGRFVGKEMNSDFNVNVTYAPPATPPPPPPPQIGCITVTKQAVDATGTAITPVPHFTFTIDNSTTTTNDDSGYAKFDNIAVGTHTIKESTLQNWSLVSQIPDSGTVSVNAGTNCATITFKNKFTPPVTTSTPPQTTSTPPVTTSTPPVTTSTPPVTTSTPPSSTSTPPITTSTPPSSTPSTPIVFVPASYGVPYTSVTPQPTPTPAVTQPAPEEAIIPNLPNTGEKPASNTSLIPILSICGIITFIMFTTIKNTSGKITLKITLLVVLALITASVLWIIAARNTKTLEEAQLPQEDENLLAADVLTSVQNIPKVISPAREAQATQNSAQVSQTRLKIDSIGVDAPIEAVGLLSNGAMAAPKSLATVGWFKFGPTPGTIGNSVLAGHVNGGANSKQGVFHNLSKLTPSDTIKIVDKNGTEKTFRVTHTEVYDYKKAPLREIFGTSTTANLNLITCTGTWIPQEKTYDKRLVVFTELIK